MTSLSMGNDAKRPVTPFPPGDDRERENQMTRLRPSSTECNPFIVLTRLFVVPGVYSHLERQHDSPAKAGPNGKVIQIQALESATKFLFGQ